MLHLACTGYSHVYSWLTADLSYTSCHGPKEANLFCQPWHSKITITQTVRGEDYIVHHAMTAKDSERQNLLAAGTAGSPYTLAFKRFNLLSRCWLQGYLVNGFFWGGWHSFVRRLLRFLNHCSPAVQSYEILKRWLQWDKQVYKVLIKRTIHLTCLVMLVAFLQGNVGLWSVSQSVTEIFER